MDQTIDAWILPYRDDPDPALDSAGFIDLICGRPYVNLDREPLLYFRDFPYGYDFAAIRARPQLAIYPKLETVATRKTGRETMRSVTTSRRYQMGSTSTGTTGRPKRSSSQNTRLR